MALIVTERAAEALFDTLESVEREPEQVLRLVPQQGGLTLTLDEQQESDQTVEYQGSTVMVVEPEIGDRLTGITLDYDNDEGRLTLRD
jgi:Fe-S cluster assembly iron-binding protein IscA